MALPMLVSVAVGLRLLGLARLYRRLASWSRRRPDPGVGMADPEILAAGVARVAGGLPWRPRCLERSLALWFLLRRRGLAAQLLIGVRKADGTCSEETPARIEAHAWVELDGRVVGDRPDVRDRFEVFDNLDAIDSPSVTLSR